MLLIVLIRVDGAENSGAVVQLVLQILGMLREISIIVGNGTGDNAVGVIVSLSIDRRSLPAALVFTDQGHMSTGPNGGHKSGLDTKGLAPIVIGDGDGADGIVTILQFAVSIESIPQILFLNNISRGIHNNIGLTVRGQGSTFNRVILGPVQRSLYPTGVLVGINQIPTVGVCLVGSAAFGSAAFGSAAFGSAAFGSSVSRSGSGTQRIGDSFWILLFLFSRIGDGLVLFFLHRIGHRLGRIHLLLGALGGFHGPEVVQDAVQASSIGLAHGEINAGDNTVINLIIHLNDTTQVGGPYHILHQGSHIVPGQVQVGGVNAALYAVPLEKERVGQGARYLVIGVATLGLHSLHQVLIHRGLLDELARVEELTLGPLNQIGSGRERGRVIHRRRFLGDRCGRSSRDRQATDHYRRKDRGNSLLQNAIHQ